MANIQFNYLYRDGANYKQFGFVIFKNISGISLEDATSKVRSKLISYEFLALKIGACLAYIFTHMILKLITSGMNLRSLN